MSLPTAPPETIKRRDKLKAPAIIYAIGDIHGEYNKLIDILAQAKAHHERRWADRDAWLVTLGDYVDRGPRSKDVVELLMSEAEPLAMFKTRVHLRGNHEQMMVEAIEGVHRDVNYWSYNGGDATLASYGATTSNTSAVPTEHIEWLAARPLAFEAGDFFFAHGGIAPGRPLEKQRETDMLWIREAFTESRVMHPKRIVHGHTWDADEPVIRPNRIGIDTGAGYAGGRLTCVVLDPEDAWGLPVHVLTSNASR